jgi:hypothetical protein
MYLDALIAEPRLVEVDHVDVGASPEVAWQHVRHGDLGSSPLVRALFAVRTLPSRLRGRETESLALSIDDFAGTGQPGFHLLADDGASELVVGAIGKVWEPDIPFLDVADAEAYAAFYEPGWVKVAWALRVEPREGGGSRISFDLRVGATDDESWKRFRRYFRLIGPGSQCVRSRLLASWGGVRGPADADRDRPLPGDDLLPDAVSVMTHARTIRARPEEVWPWLVQMGCRRAGFYSWDLLDNAGIPSAREVHPELQTLHVGDVIPASPEGDEGFEVLRVEPDRVLVLGGQFDNDAGRQVPFGAVRPERFWQVTWTFVLVPDGAETRLYVRARAAYPPGEGLQVAGIRLVHHFMQGAQLRHLADRVEGRLPRDSWRDVATGAAGAAGMVLDLLTPFLRPVRSHWGLDAAAAGRTYPGDDLVPEPRWSWTHGVEIDADPDNVWPWVAQIGADRGGFYSLQWLENLAGCAVRNAEAVHEEWAHEVGDQLVLHPEGPGMAVVEVEPGRHLLAYAAPDAEAQAAGEPWATATWLFFLEPLPGGRTRLVSRFRSDCSDGVAQRLRTGPYFTEAIGFVMDRQMLLGITDRVRRRRLEVLTTPSVAPSTTREGRGTQ